MLLIPFQNKFKVNLWSRDDAPVIRPVLNADPQQPRLASMFAAAGSGNPAGRARRPEYFDGYGGQGCEKITKVSGRSFVQSMGNVGLILASGTLVFGMLLYLKGDKSKKAAN